MIVLRKLTSLAAAGAFIFSVAPASAQTEETAPGQPPHQQGTQPSPSETGQPPESMREMMREMMQEMMQEMMLQRGPQAGGERQDEAEPRGERRGHGGERMGRPGMRDGRDMRRDFGGGMRSGAMHGAGMRVMFAIIDADGDGELSPQEVQDFQARIFNAVDEDGDGRVDLAEIQSFFHGSAEEPTR